ncbi:hypothetical protein OYC64_017418 [Pagothenia borchgrevinki]|uniref:Uncharacterized protein n=1 Tax=Pagothenia borchgrevinki TaxID=8213 RepID=A0ABD2GM65_PAGBO
MLHDLSVLDTGNWPSTPGIRHGEAQVKRLCRRFNLGEEQAVNGMRDVLEHPDSEPESLKPINGPPVTLFESRKYVTTWLRSHRSATQARRQCTPQMPEYKHIWKAL